MTADSRVLPGLVDEHPPLESRRHLEAAPELSVHLQHHEHLLIPSEILVAFGPRGFHQHRLAAQPLPEFLREMGRHGVEERDDRFDRLAHRPAGGLAGGVRQALRKR